MNQFILISLFISLFLIAGTKAYDPPFDVNKNYEVSDDQCKIDCQQARFDHSKDCFETGNDEKCGCVAHCCWAFDCRIWSMFAQCRKKCRVVEWSRFGKAQNDRQTACDRFPCTAHHLLDWDLRNLNDPEEINCVQHCCYAFNCKRYSGFCREACRAAT